MYNGIQLWHSLDSFSIKALHMDSFNGKLLDHLKGGIFEDEMLQHMIISSMSDV